MAAMDWKKLSSRPLYPGVTDEMKAAELAVSPTLSYLCSLANCNAQAFESQHQQIAAPTNAAIVMCKQPNKCGWKNPSLVIWAN